MHVQFSAIYEKPRFIKRISAKTCHSMAENSK